MPKEFDLIALESAAKLPAGKDLPARLLVLPWGEHETRLGKVLCNETTLAELPANQAKRKYDRIALDFQHNSVNAADPLKVAGYGTPEIVEGEGVYLSAIDYTAEGRDMLAGGHYPDISPAVVRNAKGEVVAIHSVGAVRQGEIDGVTLFSAADDIATFMADEADDEGDDDGDPEKLPEPGDLRSTLVGLLNALAPEANLAADASDGDIAAAARAAAERLKAGPAPEEIAAMAADVRAMKADLAGSSRRSVLDRAAREGKVVPLSAEEIERLDIATLESLVSRLPETVPLESRLNGAVDDFQAHGPGRITPEMREVARQLGMKPEDLAA